ncbi:NAD(P)-dependent oxidoreductase [Dictyobacter arantiisoli]|uniref:3-hydroxyisobutyrate dehydrogenase n=1 Tax=Dictyobacter arantiisoli TaxID=2014874 RepID=A0A5A5TJ01_9CHLR|nr:NAD(P)-dependent oxidoreductase [Dictyobacter arantiisoli]GCF11322.1 3-hydroxyisobutyrate dehydrogenase [Dictyobacter arantiisoli]
MAHVGFVGLGEMGGRIAQRLLAAGHTVTGYNRTQSKAQWLLDAGMLWADSPFDVAQAGDIVFTMVSHTAALQEVTGGPNGILAGLTPGKVYVDMSTVSPTFSQALAEQVAAKGAKMLDVPVSGSVITLEQGNLSLMIGGDKATFEQIKEVLLAIGPRATYVGENGKAVLMKIALNLSLAVQFQALSEGILLAEKGGISRETALEVFLNSVLASPSLKYRAPFILNKPANPWFNVNMMQKDLLLAQELGRTLNVPLPGVAIANETLTMARGMGLAEEDFAIMFEALARISGVSHD